MNTTTEAQARAALTAAATGDRATIGAAYAETVGYDCFADDPDMTTEHGADLLAGYAHQMMADGAMARGSAGLRVKLHRTGGNAFATLTTADAETSFHLQPGMTAGASLRRHAEDLRQRAARLIWLAERAELAAELI